MAIDDTYVSVVEAAVILGIARETVHRRIKAGTLRAERAGGRRVLLRREVEALAAREADAGGRIFRPKPRQPRTEG